MNIKISRKLFITALNKVSSLVEKNSAQLVLRNILLNVVDNKLLIVSCDTQAQIATNVELLESKDESSTTVSCQKLLDIVKQLPEGTINIFFKDKDKSTLSLVMGESNFILATVDSDQYPSIEFNDLNISTSIKITQSVLGTILSKTAFTMGSKDSREFLNACLFHIEPKKLTIVTSDSHRISSIFTEIANEEENKFLIPRKSILELNKLLGTSGDEYINILFTDSLVRVTTDSFDFISSLINARYPDYSQVLPVISENDAVLTIEKEEFKNCCSRVAILSNEAYRGVYVNFEENLITLTTSNPAQETAKEIVSVNCKNHPKEKIGYNINYFIEAIEFCSNEEIEIFIVNSDLKSAKNKAAVFIYKDKNCYGESVVLPIRMMDF